LPDIDDHIVSPGSRYEVHDGELVYVPPADPPHALTQAALLVLLTANVRPGLLVACELLTRTSATNDFASDASVYPAARNPKTGGRQLDHLSFEVVSTQSMSRAAHKASQLRARGVRRVIGIDIEHECVQEWSVEAAEWVPLSGPSIEDPLLAGPISIALLLEAAKSDEDTERAISVSERLDDAIAMGLLAKKTPRMESMKAAAAAEGVEVGRREGVEAGRREGVEVGRREGHALGAILGRIDALLLLLSAHGIALEPADRARIADERDRARIERWLMRASSVRRVADLFAED
jgi:Uma2 family endonuclease